MRIENTSEAQRHLTAVGGETAIVPGRRDGVNGSVEVTKAFVEGAKVDIDGYVKDGVLVLADGPKAVLSVPTDDEAAKAEVEAALKRQAMDAAAKDKPKK